MACLMKRICLSLRKLSYITLENGFKIAVRPSGTEPKIKFYIFGESAPNPQDLIKTKEKIINEVEGIASFFERRGKQKSGVNITPLSLNKHAGGVLKVVGKSSKETCTHRTVN